MALTKNLENAPTPELLSVLRRPMVASLLVRHGLPADRMPPREFLARVHQAAMPVSYRYAKLALVLLFVFPFAAAVMAGSLALHMAFANTGDKLPGVVGFFSVVLPFVGGMMLAMLLANLIPMPRGWRHEYNSLAKLLGRKPSGNQERRIVRPFLLVAPILVLVGCGLALVPGRW